MRYLSRCRRRLCANRRATMVERIEPRVLLSSYTVTNLNDSGPGSLREGIQAVTMFDSNGQVGFAPGLSGTITLTSGPIVITNGVNINGPGAGLITLSGNHISKVIEINGFWLVNLSGVTIANGNAGNAPGGGIDSSGLLDVYSCAFTNNAAAGQSGGAIYSTGYLDVEGCSFANNSAGAGGGAIDDQSGGARVVNCTFTANTARGTGAQGWVGAISNYDNSNLLIVDGSAFSNNSAYGGGAIYNYAAPHPGGGYDFGSMHVANSSFSGNSATYGGAIQNGGTMGLVSSTLYNNSAATAGGAVESTSGFRITNCTLVGNHANTAGGLNVDLYSNGQPSNGELHNSIVAGNTRVSTTAASDISVAGTGVLIGTYDLVGTGGAGTIYNGSYGNKVGIANPKLGPFGNYGGRTPTIPLLAGSPALDAGSNADSSDTWYYPPVPLTTDQRGLPRIYNATMDIGAYEAQPPALAGDVNHDGKVDFSDLLVLAQHYRSTAQPLWEGGDLTGDGTVAFPDLLVLAQNYGQSTTAAAASSLEVIRRPTGSTIMIRRSVAAIR